MASKYHHSCAPGLRKSKKRSGSSTARPLVGQVSDPDSAKSLPPRLELTGGERLEFSPAGNPRSLAENVAIQAFDLAENAAVETSHHADREAAGISDEIGDALFRRGVEIPRAVDLER